MLVLMVLASGALLSSPQSSPSAWGQYGPRPRPIVTPPVQPWFPIFKPGQKAEGKKKADSKKAEPKTAEPKTADHHNPGTKKAQVRSDEEAIGLRLLVRRDGRGQYTDENFGFRPGDTFRVLVTAQLGGYLYIYNPTADGDATQLFPDPRINGGDNRVPGGTEYVVPANGWFGFRDKAQVEQMYVFLSPQRIPELEELATVDNSGGGARSGPTVCKSFGVALNKLRVKGRKARDEDDTDNPPVWFRLVRLHGEEARVDPLPEPKAEPKTEPKNPPQPEPKPGQKSETKPDTKTEPTTPNLPGDRPVGRLTAFLVADTDSNIGTSVQADLDNVKRLLSTVPPASLRVITLTGKDARPEVLLDRIHQLDVRSDEAVFLHYAGHGGWSERDGHFLAFSTGNVRRAQIRDALSAKGPALLVLMTDCCANLVRVRVPEINTNPMLMVASRRDDRWKMLGDLFFRHNGVIDINAAGKGEYAQGDPDKGGCFTTAFCDLLRGELVKVDTNGDGRLTWDEFFPQLQTRTHDNSVRLTNGSTEPTEKPHRPAALEMSVRLIRR